VERSLVELAQAGDEEAYARLAKAAGGRLMAVAYRILRDVHDAEDAVQIALVAAWRDLPSLREPERFDAWLHRLLIRACFAEARRHRRWRLNSSVLPIEGPAGPDTTLGVGLRDELEEVSHILEIPLGTAKSRLHYAIRTLRAALDADARAVRTAERLA